MKEFTWGTADGRRLKLEEIDDQHLSNIYWFQRILMDYTHPAIKDEIFKRFKKPIPLPFKPLPIKGEIDALKDYIVGTDILFEGVVIGTISHLKK